MRWTQDEIDVLTAHLATRARYIMKLLPGRDREEVRQKLDDMRRERRGDTGGCVVTPGLTGNGLHCSISGTEMKELYRDRRYQDVRFKR